MAREIGVEEVIAHLAASERAVHGARTATFQRPMPIDVAERDATYQKRILAGRIGLPDEIAKMVLSVIDNEYVNGTTLEVDGGFRF